MRILRATTMLCGLLSFIAGCGGGGDSVGQGARTLPFDPNQFTNNGANYVPIKALGGGSWSGLEVVNAGENSLWFANAINNMTLTQTVPSTNAVYNGSITITREIPSQSNINGKIYYGRMQMNANFGNSVVSGNMGDFVKVDVANPVPLEFRRHRRTVQPHLLAQSVQQV